MIKSFEIEETTLQIDREATEKFYLTEINITDNCDCNDCSYYANILIKEPFEIFQMLGEMGIDLRKNLSSEPDGVWCVRGNNKTLIHCNHTYQVFGKMNTGDKKEINYSKFENGYRVNAKFSQSKTDTLYVILRIDMVSDDKEIIKI